VYWTQCENQLIKPTLQALEYIHKTCTKSHPTFFILPWVPPSGSFYGGFSSAFEPVVHTMDHFKSTPLPLWRLSYAGTHGVTKPVGGDCVHLLCIYSIACKVGSVSWAYNITKTRQRFSIIIIHHHSCHCRHHLTVCNCILGSPRLGTYSRFREERDPLYLGTAKENAPVCSKLLFHWVTPLMKKGAKKKLGNSEDLYDLPTKLTPAYLCSQLEMAMTLPSVTKEHNDTG